MTSKKEKSRVLSSPQRADSVSLRNPPNKIQRILQFAEHAHGDDKKGNDTDQSGEGSVDGVTGTMQHGGNGVRPFFTDNLLQLTKQFSLHHSFINDNCCQGNGKRQERGEGEQRVIGQGGA